MAAPDDVIDRTDLLIQRRRTFLATRPPPQATAPPPPSISKQTPPIEDDDLPVLTEIVSPEAAVSEQKYERLNETQITLLASEIAHAVGEQLANELPALIETTLLQTRKDLRAGISSIMESALRDFIGRHRLLHAGAENQLREQDTSSV